LDNMGDGVIVADQNGKFLVFNPAAERMFGLGATDTPQEQWSARYGLFLPDMTTPFPPDDLPLARALRGESVDEVEMFVLHAKAPEGLGASITGRPLQSGDRQPLGGVIVCRDITARKHSQQRQAAQFAVARVLAEDLPLREAAPRVLEALCTCMGWDFGAFWQVDREAGLLNCLDLWYPPALPLKRFAIRTRGLALPAGVGPPRRVRARRQA